MITQVKNKKELRKEILQKRDAFTLEERMQKSREIAEKVIASREFINADKILLFASYKSEVDTKAIFAKAKKLGKMIYYPKVIGKEMKFYQVQEEADFTEGYRGILEPKEILENCFFPQKKETVFVLMPGAVFDEEGNRIGYGGGYYDRFLKEIEEAVPPEHVCKMAVAFECQMTEAGMIQRESHDRLPNYIVTEKRILKIINSVDYFFETMFHSGV